MSRVYHRYEKWESFQCGFYSQLPPAGMTDDMCRVAYRDFLRDLAGFQRGIERVFVEWPISCEQFLTNNDINRIAWLGQASMCIATGVPAKYRGGFFLLTETEQVHANRLSEYNIREWELSTKCLPRASGALSARMARQRVFGWDS